MTRPSASSAPGWLSIALGAPCLAAPRATAQQIGISPTPRTTLLVRLIGVQECIVGAGILARRDPAGWIWSRVVGDIAHLLLLGNALTSRHRDRSKLNATIAAVLGITAVDVATGLRLRGGPRAAGRSLHARAAITINRPRAEVYRHWRNLENLPTFMDHLQSVQQVDDARSHWVAKGPARRRVEWDAQVVRDDANECIEWRSLEGASVENRGRVTFSVAPQAQGTEVHVELHYAPPAGRAGAAIAKLFGEEPHQQIRDDLRRFKQVLETGEVVRSAGTPTGARTRRQFRQRPAQPLSSQKVSTT